MRRVALAEILPQAHLASLLPQAFQRAILLNPWAFVQFPDCFLQMRMDETLAGSDQQSVQTIRQSFGRLTVFSMHSQESFDPWQVVLPRFHPLHAPTSLKKAGVQTH